MQIEPLQLNQWKYNAENDNLDPYYLEGQLTNAVATLELPLLSSSTFAHCIRYFGWYRDHQKDPPRGFYSSQLSCEQIIELCLAAHYLQCFPMLRFCCRELVQMKLEKDHFKNLPHEVTMELLLSMSLLDLLKMEDDALSEPIWFELLQARFSVNSTFLSAVMIHRSRGALTLLSPPSTRDTEKTTFIAPLVEVKDLTPRSPSLRAKGPIETDLEPKSPMWRPVKASMKMEASSPEPSPKMANLSHLTPNQQSFSHSSLRQEINLHRMAIRNRTMLRRQKGIFDSPLNSPSTIHSSSELSALNSPTSAMATGLGVNESGLILPPSPNIAWSENKTPLHSPHVSSTMEFKNGPTPSFWRDVFGQIALQTIIQDIASTDSKEGKIPYPEALECIKRIINRSGLTSLVLRHSDPYVSLALASTFILRYPSFPSSLQAIDLSKIGIDESMCTVISELIRPGTGLRRLNLGNNRIRADGAKIISEALASPKCCLEVLHIEHNGIGPQGAMYIADALATNTKLVRLGLGYNQIRSDGVESLCNALTLANMTLRGLDVANNYAGDKGAYAVAEMLKHNSTLQLLRMWDPTMTLDAGNMIVDSLKHNRSLVELGLGSSSLDPAMRAELAAILKRNTDALRSPKNGGSSHESQAMAYTSPAFSPNVFSPDNQTINDPYAERRRKEVDLLYGADTVYSDVWFLMDERWLQEWRNFVSQSSLSDPPGPISNSALLESDGKTPRANLRKLFDYRGVAPVVYKLFHSIYGGGPPIIRTTIDIYTEPASFNVDQLLG